MEYLGRPPNYNWRMTFPWVKGSLDGDEEYCDTSPFMPWFYGLLGSNIVLLMNASPFHYAAVS